MGCVMSGQEKWLMVMVGGIGGYVFLGLVVVYYLMDQGWQVCWLGIVDCMEVDLVLKNGIEIDFICIFGLCGKGIKVQLLVLVCIFNVWCQVWVIMKCFQLDVVLGMGGYVFGSGGLVVWLLGILVVFYE